MQDNINGLVDPRIEYDLDELEKTIIEGDTKANPIGRKEDLIEHLEYVRTEFLGYSALLYYHAFLTVFIRRKIHHHEALDQFKRLWKEKRDFLIAHLGIKWLRSALDTVVDNDFVDAEKNLAFSGIFLLNTIKLYETDRLSLKAIEVDYSKMESQQVLFNDFLSYSVGAGDMIYNMVERFNHQISSEYWTKEVVMEIFRRVNRYDTVYKRMGDVHKYEHTHWHRLIF